MSSAPPGAVLASQRIADTLKLPRVEIFLVVIGLFGPGDMPADIRYSQYLLGPLRTPL